jgi:phosphohistidine phosphatase
MDLILWRHAEAQELEGGLSDLERSLTPRGQRQAARMAAWLHRHLPANTRILASPALRTMQTAQALGRPFMPHDELLPGAAPAALLKLADWPVASGATLIVGHQPTLGQTIAHLLGMTAPDCSIKKGAIWWLRTRQHETRLLAVLGPEML